ncbi:MAG: PAS domain S-box protein [Betaproteobacteria bacterium]|nr:PAS domain S-box protein [Betaproteobacteria bacterium]
MNGRWLAFLRQFLPAALLIVSGAWLYTESEQEHVLEQIKSKETLKVGLRSGALARHTQGVIQDLRYLAGSSALQHPGDGPASRHSPELRRVEEDFQNFMRAKPVFDRIRWLDAGGKEVVRVDRAGGTPRLAPPDTLQFRGERGYFRETVRREAGSVYIAPPDPDREDGRAGEPSGSVLRFAIPVAGERGAGRGIVVLDYPGAGMVARFAATARQAGDTIALIDGEGYRLHAPNAGGARDPASGDENRSLADRFPATWARLRGDSGQFEDERGLWTYESVYLPPGDGSSSGQLPRPAADAPTTRADARRWLVVSHLPGAQLAATIRRSSWEEWTLAAFLLLIFALGARRVVRGAAQERETEQRFRAVFDHAMVGMARVSPDKRWIEVNPALCRILGTTAAGLVGKTWGELTHAQDLAAEETLFDTVLGGGSDGYSTQKRFVRADGSPVHAFVANRAVRKPDGRIDCFAVVVEDINERVLAEEAREQSAKTLQRFIDHLPGLAYVKSADSRILVASQGFLSMLGIDPKAIIGRTSQEVFSGEFSKFGKKIADDDARVLASGKTEVFDETFNGRFYESTKFVIPRDDSPPDLGGITIDVTGRRSAEQNLAKQVRRSAVLLELPKKANELPEKAFMQYALECAEDLTQSDLGFIHFVGECGDGRGGACGAELAAWSQRTLGARCTAAFDCHSPITESGIWADAAREKRPVVINDYAAARNLQDLPEHHPPLTRLMSVPVVDNGAARMVTGVGNKAGEYLPYDVETVQLIGDETWRIVRRQRAESALRLAMQVVNASPVVCFRWAASEGWPVVFVSENVTQWGYTQEDLQAGRPPFGALVHPDDLLRVAGEVGRHTAAGLAGYEQEYRLLTADKRVIWVVDRTIVRRDDEGRPAYYDGVLTDITERKTQQLMLADNLDRQQQLNKRLEEAHNQLLQAEKMASIGQLAAGVAHELNNPIGFVHSNLGTLDGYLHDLMEIIGAYEKAAGESGKNANHGNSGAPPSPGDPGGSGETRPRFEAVHRIMEERDFDFLRGDIFNLLAESKEGLGRVRKIVQDLKSFSRVGEQEWQEADLHRGIDSTLNIVWNELKYKCKIVKEYGEIPHIYCLISQLNQVFMNLLVNAGHAIETQGTITIRTRRHGDDAVCIEFGDTGRGIAPEHINRIFEPFFTTKPVGKGTGLGLSLSYSIIERHRGRIEVESRVGEGSTFRLVLPVHPKRAEGAEGAEGAESTGNTETENQVLETPS